MLVTLGLGLSLEDEEKPDCAGSACPAPAEFHQPPQCGLWIGPSPIKAAEEHGFGLGMFTGKYIPQGTTVEQELLIPIHDSLMHKEMHHPPLREYVWEGDNMPAVTLESRLGTFMFMPGLAGIVPCTSKNYNLELSGRGGNANTPDYNIRPDSAGFHRGSNSMTGAFSYRHNISYTAVRDIVIGEELTVQCNDDDFDGGAYFLSQYLNDDAFVCVDSNARAAPSVVGGQGLFAKNHLSKNSVITSTPVVPVDRKEMVMRKKKGEEARQQLLLNYAYGHPNSDLLLLPYGPKVNYINHPPYGKTANAKIQWHPVTDKNNNRVLSRRQQFHHPELLEDTAKNVANTHGKGLMIDIVALRDIAVDEEIYIDYGEDWVEAHKAHVAQWRPTEADKKYVSAEEYGRTHDVSVIRTIAEQRTDPYPENLETVCFWDTEDYEDEEGDETDVYFWSQREEDDECLRPCTILDRLQHSEGGEQLYMVKMLPIDSDEVIGLCTLEDPEVVTNVPRRAIRIIDRPYTSDIFMKNAFRHEIGVPEGFYPETWMKQKLRGKALDSLWESSGEEFKRRIS